MDNLEEKEIENSNGINSDGIDSPPNKPNRSLSSLSVVKSVMAGLIGVQSQKNRETDFEKGRASDYIIYGILAVIALMTIMGVIVNSVISSAGR